MMSAETFYDNCDIFITIISLIKLNPVIMYFGQPIWKLISVEFTSCQNVLFKL